MKKINRLLKTYDYKTVLDEKKYFSNKEFSVHYKENNLEHIRIGISVSSKLGNSVVRHKIKRQINEMIKEIVDVRKSKDLVIIVRKNYLLNNFDLNKESLRKIITKI